MRLKYPVLPLALPLFFLSVLYFGCATKPQKPAEIFSDRTVDRVSEGILFFQHGEYHRAIKVFTGVIERNPGSSLLAESQWMLARSYEGAGMPKDAIAEYTLFLQNFPDGGHALEARTRLEALRREFLSSQWIVGLLSDPTAGPDDRMRDRIEEYRRGGINTLVVPLFDRQGVRFRTDRAPVASDLLDRFVPLAHAVGMMVLGEVSPREMTWISSARPDLADMVFRENEKKMVRSERPDLFNREVWRDLSGLLRDARRSGVDGFLLNLSIGPDEGWSASAASDFKAAFGQRITPAVLARGKGSTYPPLFWHWVGWRVRRLTERAGEMKAALPGVKWGVVLSADAVISPREGLVNNSQDLVALRGLGFDYYVISTGRATDAGKLESKIKSLLPEFHQRILFAPLPAFNARPSEFAAWGGVIAAGPVANTP
jgi:tetratricopeptide (TPR) repeat protein